METEEAQKALKLALKHDANGDTTAAIKWAKKSIAIHSTPVAQALLTRLEKNGASGSAAKTSATQASTSADGIRSRSSAKPNGSASSSRGAAPETKREYTQAQAEVVSRVRKAGGDFYKVLGVEKEVDENGIKKAYRKLALQLHPDKNGAPGADEAFKLVSKAFTIMSDADKRAAYDRFGGDPDNRYSAAGAAAGGGASPFGSAMGRGRGGMHGEEIDPQDLFNMFFGGGMGGMGGNFGGTTFSFGVPGARTHFHRQARSTGARPQAQQPRNASMLLQLLPLIILGLFSLLSYAPALFSTPDPAYTFEPSGSYKTMRLTPKRSIPYYVNDHQFNTHPIITGDSRVKLSKFEETVENAYVRNLYNDCERRLEYQQQRLSNTRGFLGIGADYDAAARIRSEVYSSCERLKDFGIVVN